jgi:tetratricopeptide (TPR) repeat protein
MGISIRVLIAVAFFWLAFIFLREAQLLQGKPDQDGSRVVLLFAGVVFSGLVGAALVATTVIPQLGESVGNFLFNPNEKAEEHPHGKAVAAVGSGDYQRAVNEYRKIYEKNPDDTLALSEAARVLCEKMHQCEPAVALLEEALERDLPAEDAAFLSLRLVDVYWHHQHDIPRARELLLHIMELLPDSKHAATASHKLHEIDRAMMMQGLGGGVVERG